MAAATSQTAARACAAFPIEETHGIPLYPGNRLLAAWFAFDPSGTQQAWFTGVGTYAGNVAQITAVDMPVGGRWIPNFNPAQVTLRRWGAMTLTFSDCNSGRVDWNSTQGYGTGSMNINRLTLPAGLACP